MAELAACLLVGGGLRVGLKKQGLRFCIGNAGSLPIREELVLDRFAISGKAFGVLLGRGRFRILPSPMQFNAKDLGEEYAAVRFGNMAKEIFDSWAFAAFPSSFELVTKSVDELS